MARPSQETIETFMSITGASESVAFQKLEEYGGNLNEAVNAYFLEWDGHISNPTPAVSSPRQHEIAELPSRLEATPSRLLRVLSAARSFKPSSLLDPNYRRNLLNEIGASALPSHQPVASHTGGVMGVPVAYSSWNEQSHHPGLMPSDYDARRTSSSHPLETEGHVSRNDNSHLYDDNIEEQMIQAAIEASKQEDSSGSRLMQRQLDLEDDELTHAISLSLETAEQEQAMRELALKDRDHQLGVCGFGIGAEKTSNGSREAGNSSVQQRAEAVQARTPFSFISEHDTVDHPHQTKNAFPYTEWGGISPKELDEAVRLEAALFGEIPEGTSRHSMYEPLLQSDPDRSVGSNSVPVSHQSSSSAVEQRLLRKQQDDEYLASLLADREKEANGLKDSESLRLKEDESWKKLLEEERVERWLAAKETSLPHEPALDDENAVTLLVRMPDGSRRGRRFLKSDKLQFLFDFIDIGRAVKPGTYRVVLEILPFQFKPRGSGSFGNETVRAFPRRAFNISDSSLSLSEVGLTSKQEALFLEFV